MAMPRSVSSFIVCAHRSRSSVFIHFLSSTSLSAKQHQSGSGQSSCTRIDLKVGRNESLTRIASEVYFSFNQAINHITSHSFTSFLSTNLYIYYYYSASAVQCCVEYGRRIQSSATWSMFMFWSAHSLTHSPHWWIWSMGNLCMRAAGSTAPYSFIRESVGTVTSPMGTCGSAIKCDGTIKALIKISRYPLVGVCVRIVGVGKVLTMIS